MNNKVDSSSVLGDSSMIETELPMWVGGSSEDVPCVLVPVASHFLLCSWAGSTPALQNWINSNQEHRVGWSRQFLCLCSFLSIYLMQQCIFFILKEKAFTSMLISPNFSRCSHSPCSLGLQGILFSANGLRGILFSANEQYFSLTTNQLNSTFSHILSAKWTRQLSSYHLMAVSTVHLCNISLRNSTS